MRFRFTGHESFTCRYTWLPKAYNALVENPTIFNNDNNAMVQLGVGKNMVRSIKFWVQVFGIARANDKISSFEITSFGDKIFDPRTGLDPYLEDIRTLWLLHWKISSIKDEPLFAWHFFLNNWPNPTLSKSEALLAFSREIELQEKRLSDFTKELHFDTFLHTYCPAKGKKQSEVLEDSLDCPLTELALIIPAGERTVAENGRRESIYEFRQEAKREITPSLFAYCIFDYWNNHKPHEATLSFSDIAFLPGSLGQLFKLSEPDIRSRLETLNKDSGGLFEYISSAAIPRIVKHGELNKMNEEIMLGRIFSMKSKNPKLVKQVHAV